MTKDSHGKPLEIGDLVKVSTEPRGVLMIVYDFDNSDRVALCNWLTIHSHSHMHIARHYCDDLVFVARGLRVRKVIRG